MSSSSGHDFGAIDSAIAKAKGLDNGKPTIIIAKTIIGKGIPEVEGTNAAHGEVKPYTLLRIAFHSLTVINPDPSADQSTRLLV